MKIKAIILLLTVLFASFVGFECNYPETVSVSSKFTLASDSTVLYQFVKHYFILVPGDTALFYGTRKCTTTVNGVITAVVNDSAYLRTITYGKTVISINDTPHVVHPQLHQYSSTFAAINENTQTRYFEKTDSATLQIAYVDKGVTRYPEEGRRIVMPKRLLVGEYGWFDTDSTSVPMNNAWKTSPLVQPPLGSLAEAVTFKGFSIATGVISLPKSSKIGYTVNGNEYKDGIFVKSYFTISGETKEQNLIVRIGGSIMITRTYFVRTGLIDQLMRTSIQKTYSDGSVEKMKETLYVARGPEGAKQFSDKDLP